MNEVKDFLLSQTLECGQCFHFIKLADEEYLISARNKILHIGQKDESLIFYNTNQREFDEIWKHYFDLDRDYSEIKNTLLKEDGKLKEAIEAMWGVRILNQDFFETLISFIISQNQQIPRIKQIVANVSAACGVKGEGIDIFPDAQAILSAGEDVIRQCKTGFRAPYIMDACNRFAAGLLDEKTLREADYEDCISVLKQVKGIGDKVANCVALFALDKRNAFPVDVWIKRIMETVYFGREASAAEIMDFAKERFGEYGGYAQQYLFYYGKTRGIGKKDT